MSYDGDLAERIRDALADNPDVNEKAMFGGLAFLVGGQMAVAASGQGGLLVRAVPAEAEELLARDGVEPMEMRGRPMRGWLRVDAQQWETEDQLAEWIDVGVRAVPAKKARPRVRRS